MTSFCLQNLINLSLEDNFPWINEWKYILNDIQTSAILDESLPTLKVIYREKLSLEGFRKLEKDIYIKKDELLDLKYKLILSKESQHLYRMTVTNPSLEWLSWFMQILFLKNGVTFIHGAALIKNGEAILFPSWGGVGKTALVKKFVDRWDWKMLSDDLVVVSKFKVCYPFPKPMVLYRYHESLFPEVFKKGNGPILPKVLNSWFTSLVPAIKGVIRPFPKLLQYARRNNPQSVRIMPSEVFGSEKLGGKGSVQHVVWMDRIEGLDKAKLIQINESLSSRIYGSTLNEFDPWCVKLTHIGMGVGLFDNQELSVRWMEILEGCLQDIPRYLIYLPAAMPVSQVPDAVHELLVTHQIIKE